MVAAALPCMSTAVCEQGCEGRAARACRAWLCVCRVARAGVQGMAVCEQGCEGRRAGHGCL